MVAEARQTSAWPGFSSILASIRPRPDLQAGEAVADLLLQPREAAAHVPFKLGEARLHVELEAVEARKDRCNCRVAHRQLAELGRSGR